MPTSSWRWCVHAFGPAPPACPQLLDELQELTSQAQDLDVALIDKKIDQVGEGCLCWRGGACTSRAAFPLSLRLLRRLRSWVQAHGTA